MLQPKRVKYRRPHIIKYEGHCKSAPKVAFGEFGLQALLVIPKEVVKSGSESSHI